MNTRDRLGSGCPFLSFLSIGKETHFEHVPLKYIAGDLLASDHSSFAARCQRNRPEPVRDDMGNIGAAREPNCDGIGWQFEVLRENTSGWFLDMES